MCPVLSLFVLRLKFVWSCLSNSLRLFVLITKLYVIVYHINCSLVNFSVTITSVKILILNWPVAWYFLNWNLWCDAIYVNMSCLKTCFIKFVKTFSHINKPLSMCVHLLWQVVIYKFCWSSSYPWLRNPFTCKIRMLVAMETLFWHLLICWWN